MKILTKYLSIKERSGVMSVEGINSESLLQTLAEQYSHCNINLYKSDAVNFKTKNMEMSDFEIVFYEIKKDGYVDHYLKSINANLDSLVFETHTQIHAALSRYRFEGYNKALHLIFKNSEGKLCYLECYRKGDIYYIHFLDHSNRGSIGDCISVPCKHTPDYWSFFEGTYPNVAIVDERLYDIHNNISKEININENNKQAFVDKIIYNNNKPASYTMENKVSLFNDFIALFGNIDLSKFDDYINIIKTNINTEKFNNTAELRKLFGRHFFHMDYLIKSSKVNNDYHELFHGDVNIFNLKKNDNFELSILDIYGFKKADEFNNHPASVKDKENQKNSHFILINQSTLYKVRTKTEGLQETLESFMKWFPANKDAKFVVYSETLKSSELNDDVPFVSFLDFENALKDPEFTLPQLAFNA